MSRERDIRDEVSTRMTYSHPIMNAPTTGPGDRPDDAPDGPDPPGASDGPRPSGSRHFRQGRRQGRRQAVPADSGSMSRRRVVVICATSLTVLAVAGTVGLW